MSLEIERKFLVKNLDDALAQAVDRHSFIQAYMSRTPEATVRVRIADNSRAWLTIKGRNQGAVRHEYEYEIPVADALEMVAIAPGKTLSKTRHIVMDGGFRWEIDVFDGELAGLVLAEVELPDSNTPVALPSWLGPEVTGDPRYYNSNL